jgi:hypothetical protein
MKNTLWFQIAFFASTVGLHGQVAKPSSVTVMAVPGYTSPYQDVRFINTGSSELTLAISVSGTMFAIPENRCTNGVKPASHCDVYVTYAPLGIETDNGTLTFAFNNQTVSVPLIGEGVQSIPTISKMRGSVKEGGSQAKVTVGAPDGYKIPNGDLVDFECSIYWGEDGQTGVLIDEKTTIDLPGCNTKGENYSWACYGTYRGDPEFAASYSHANIKSPECQ